MPIIPRSQNYVAEALLQNAVSQVTVHAPLSSPSQSRFRIQRGGRKHVFFPLQRARALKGVGSVSHCFGSKGWFQLCFQWWGNSYCSNSNVSVPDPYRLVPKLVSVVCFLQGRLSFIVSVRLKAHSITRWLRSLMTLAKISRPFKHPFLHFFK